jgi:hypothetical protein
MKRLGSGLSFKPFALAQSLYDGNEIENDVTLPDVSVGADGMRDLGQLRGLGCAQEQNLGFRTKVLDLLGGFQAVCATEADIEQNHVGRQFPTLLDRFHRVPRNVDNLPTLLLAQNFGVDAMPGFNVFNYQNSNGYTCKAGPANRCSCACKQISDRRAGRLGGNH